MQFSIGFLHVTFTSSYAIRENVPVTVVVHVGISIRISHFVTDMSGLGHESSTRDSADLL